MKHIPCEERLEYGIWMWYSVKKIFFFCWVKNIGYLHLTTHVHQQALNIRIS